MKLNKKLKYFVLVLILLLAIFLRVRNLTANPAGFFCDEASIGLNAYKIWKTGRDNHSKKAPLFFESFGDYKNPVFIYSIAPFVGIFGLNEVTVRAVGVVYGMLTILIGYFIIRKLLGIKTALFFIFLLSITPWHIHFSRLGFEPIASLFWFLLAAFLLWKFKKIFWYYSLSLLAFLLAFLSYTTPKIYLLPFFATFFIVYWPWVKNNLSKGKFWLINLAFLILAAILFYSPIKTGNFFSRWNQVKQENYTLTDIGKAYFNHFSLDFLFRTGDIDFPGQFITRHSIRGMGELYWFQLPLVILGILSIFFIKKSRREKIFFGLIPLLLYPTGSMFTGLAPQATRSIMGVVPLTLLSAIGLSWSIGLIFKISRKLAYLFGVGLGIIVLISFLNFNRLFLKYPLYSSNYWGWQYGPKPIMEYFLAHKDEYDELFMEGKFNGGRIFISFYDPENLCQNKCRVGGLEEKTNQKQQLFAISFETYDKKINSLCNQFLIKKKLRYPNSKIAFLIGECI